jgi:hypothetical protein
MATKTFDDKEATATIVTPQPVPMATQIEQKDYFGLNNYQTNVIPDFRPLNPPQSSQSKKVAVKSNKVVAERRVTANPSTTAQSPFTSALLSNLGNSEPNDYFKISTSADMDRENVVKIIIYDKNNKYVTQSNFIINQLQESSQETVQVTQGFEQFMVMFFNPQISSITFGGYLIADERYDQYNSFMNLYHSFLKGSVNALNNYTIYIQFFNNQHIRAAFTNLQLAINAENYNLIPMSFSIIVLQRYFTYNLPGTNIPSKIVMTVDYECLALQLNDPKLTQAEKNDLIVKAMMDLKSLVPKDANYAVSSANLSSISLVVTYKNLNESNIESLPTSNNTSNVGVDDIVNHNQGNA